MRSIYFCLSVCEEANRRNYTTHYPEKNPMSDVDGLLTDKDIQKIDRAMGAIKLIRGHHASGPEGQKLMQEVLKMLSAGDRVICKNIAVAIDCASRAKGVQEAP
jgi:hypothetical protein